MKISRNVWAVRVSREASVFFLFLLQNKVFFVKYTLPEKHSNNTSAFRRKHLSLPLGEGQQNMQVVQGTPRSLHYFHKKSISTP
ncbi:MAG: hypothetical protein D3909_01675 [Candidatus Electrothrix sp. ATG1]|nr:hypothetical protein [Candidatus Electrothrix sp. ATG1]